MRADGLHEEPPAAEPARAAPRRPWDILGLLALSGWLVSVHAAYPGLVDPDEPRSALIARLMAERGDWLAPHLPAVFHHNYRHYPMEGDLFAYWDKPPLFFWLSALAMKALGPTALAVRLPSALSHVASVLVAYGAARWLWGRRAGFLAGAALAVAPLALVMSHVARMDALLVFLMTAMLLAALRLLGDRPKSWVWTAVLYAAAGLGLLTKGPVAVLLPAAAVGVTLLVCGRLRDWGRLRPLPGLAIMLAIAAPWFIYMHLRYPPGAGGTAGFTHAFFIAQNLERATTAQFGHSGHVPGYLLGILLLGFVPWTIFLPGLCLRLFRVARHTTRQWWTAVLVLRAPQRERTPVVLLLAWAIVIVAAFSFSRTQLAHYVAPAVPPLAVLVGGYLAERTRPGVRDRLFTTGLWFTAVAGLGCMGAMFLALRWEDLWRPHYLGLIAAIFGILAAGIVALVRGRTAACVGLTITGMLFILTFAFSADPFDVYASYSTRIESRTLGKMLQPGDAVLSFPYTPYSLAWHMWPREIRYPTATGGPDDEPCLPVLIAELNKPQRTFCMLQKKALLQVLQKEVRWPIEVLSRRPDHTLIVTRPPGSEEPSHGP